MFVPYIGVTDFTSKEQVRSMLRALRTSSGTRRLAVGVMGSFKTLSGIPSRWSDVFPDPKRYQEIFLRHDRVMNVLHYADYDGNPFLIPLSSAVSAAEESLDAVQFDMVWPDPAEVAEFAARNPDLRMILQVSETALERIGNDPRTMLEYLLLYGNSVDYVLLDKSMGRGKGMDAEALRPFVRVIARHRPDFGVVVAGGLGPDTLHLVEPLVREFPGLSIDAQGKLRPSGSALDPVDWRMAADYVSAAAGLFDRLEGKAG